MLFSTALSYLQSGSKITRKAWTPGAYILLQGVPRLREDRQLPYILYRTPDGKYTPWSPTHADILAIDWIRL